MNDSIKSIAAIMRDLDNILIYPHINMDGDALGSCSALCLALRKLGKTAYVMINEPVPKNLDFLECGCTTDDDSVIEDVNLSLMLDCNGLNRITGREDAWNRGRLKGCIDHHAVGNTDIRFDFYRAEPKSAATGELIYLLIKALKVDIDLEMANCLFAAITTDTGNFQHTNTTKRSHDIVGNFYEIEGFDSKQISALIYDRKSKEALKMESKILADLEFYENGRIAAGRVTQKLLEECDCVMSDSDGVIQRIMSIDGVEVGVLFKETATNVRASMRAKSYCNVADVATKHNGGGHVRAAGCNSEKSLEEFKSVLIPDLVEALKVRPAKSNKDNAGNRNKYGDRKPRNRKK